MVVLVGVLGATPAVAQDAGVIDEAFEADAGEPEPPAHTLLRAEPSDVLAEPPPAPAPPPSPNLDYWQIGSGLNLGLIDVTLSFGQLWGELSTVVGLPIASYQNPVFGGVLAFGYARELGFNGIGHWYFEVFVEAVVGKLDQGGASGFVAGGGWGFGFRYLLDSGWTLQFRMPCLGMVAEDYNSVHTFSMGDSILDFYQANVFGWSFFTFGRRF